MVNNKLIWIFGFFFIFYFLNKTIRSVILSNKIKKRINDEFNEIIYSNKYKVRGKND